MGSDAYVGFVIAFHTRQFESYDSFFFHLTYTLLIRDDESITTKSKLKEIFDDNKGTGVGVNSLNNAPIHVV